MSKWVAWSPCGADSSRSRKVLISWLEQQGIYTAGRYGRWEYAAMENAIIQGITAARLARKY
jgi:hypothetical protein